MSEQEKSALEGRLHNHGGSIHVEYGDQHHYVIANVSKHEVINELQATLLAGQIVLSWNEHNALTRQRDELVGALESIFYQLSYDEETTINAFRLMVSNVQTYCLEMIRKTTGKDMPLKQLGTTPE